MTTNHPTSLYAVLGLNPQATQEQIRRAYRMLLRRNHPDTSPTGSAAHDAATSTKLQQVMAAYTVLGDPARRAEYDRHPSPRQAPTSTPIRPVRRFTRADPQQPPIQAGPVVWHRAS